MNRQEALREVARTVGGWVYATGLDELIPEIDNYSEADQERLQWAQGEVQARLYRMGEPRR